MKKLFILILLGFLLVGSTTSVFASKTEEDVIDESIEYNVDDNTEENNYKEYFTIMSKMEETRLDEDKLYYQFYFDNELKYDYLKVFCISSSNVFLNDYQTIKLDYKETCNPIDLKFELNSDKIDIDEIPLYSEIKYDELCITAYAYLNDEVVDTQTQGLYLINSIHGIFVSEFSSFYTYDNYIGYLYSNSLIEEERYKLISKKITELTPVDEEEKNTKEEPKLKLFRFFDEDIFEIQEVEVESISDVVDKIDYNNKCYSSSTTSSANTPSLYISLSIKSFVGGRTLKVYGIVQWSDIRGNYHPARNIEVQIMDYDYGSDEVLGITTTDNNGNYYAYVHNQLDSEENGCDIYVRVYTKSNNFCINSNNSTSLFDCCYYYTTQEVTDVTSDESVYGKTISSQDVGSISIHQALNVGYYYFDQMNNHNISSVKVVYPTSSVAVKLGNSSYYSSILNKISIDSDDYCDWDVILHELGHKVADYIGIDSFFVNEHYVDENLSERYGKRLGIQGAWSEGWATYFSIAAQLYYNSNVLDISDIPYVADYSYTDYNLIDTSKTFSQNYLIGTGISEGNEYSVTAVLLQLFIDNNIGLTNQQVWNYIKLSQCDNFSEFYQYLKNNLNNYEKISTIGFYLEQQNIVDEPYLDNSKTKSVFSRSTPGQFYWKTAKTKDDIDEIDGVSDNFNAHEYLNQCRIEFYDSDFNFIPIYLSYKNSTNVSYTIDARNWRILTNYIDSGEYFYWCISTRQNDTPNTGPYLSSFHKAYFSDDITTITNLDTLYSGYITPGKELIYKYYVTNTGYYKFSSIGSTNINLTIYNGPYFENNYTYSDLLYGGQTAYIKITSSSKTAESFNVYVSKYINMWWNSVTETISGTNEIWFKFTANEHNFYTFYSTGNLDVYGELFNKPTYKNDYSNCLISDDDSGEGLNFLYTYELNESQEVYVRVSGYNKSVNGSFSLCVAPTTIVNNLNYLYTDYIKYRDYTIYKFTASKSGYYNFYTTGSSDTYMDIFNTPVTDYKDTTGVIRSDNNSGANKNAKISSFYMSKYQTIFIRVKTYYPTSGSYYSFVVESKKK